MKKIAILALLQICFIAFLDTNTYAQTANVGIGTITPDSSALLDLNSTTKGFLPPRMTSAQKNYISGPAKGLIVFQTDSASGLYLNTGDPATPIWQLLLRPEDIINLKEYLVSLILDTPAHGQFYHTGTEYLPISTYVNLTFNAASPTHDISLLNSTSISINKSGRYRVNWYINTYLTMIGAVASRITLNGIVTGGTYTNSDVQVISSGTLTGAAYLPMTGEVIINASAGTILRLQAASNLNGTAIASPTSVPGSNPAVSASLSIVEIR